MTWYWYPRDHAVMGKFSYRRFGLLNLFTIIPMGARYDKRKNGITGFPRLVSTQIPRRVIFFFLRDQHSCTLSLGVEMSVICFEI